MHRRCESRDRLRPRFFATAAAFRAWFEKNHALRTELLVGFHKTGAEKPSMTWPESVDEALCFGWIDGVRKSLGDAAYTIRFTPRKPTSTWSNINVAKVAKLRKAGKMRAAGEAAFAGRRAEKTGVYSFERKNPAALPPAFAKALAANAQATAFFAAQAAWYQRAAIHWIVSAKRPTTQDRRLAQLIADSAAGRKVPPLRPYD